MRSLSPLFWPWCLSAAPGDNRLVVIVLRGALDLQDSNGFTALMGALIGFYTGAVHRAQGGELPEDVLTADIDDGDPEIGEFSPWSWWPLVLASSAAVAIIGLAVGAWMVPIGLGIFVVAIIGWVYEYYRGYFAR